MKILNSLCLAALVFAGAFAGGAAVQLATRPARAAEAPKPAADVRAQRFTLVNERNVPIAALTPNGQGEACLLLNGPDAASNIILLAGAKSAALSVMSAGKTVAGIGATAGEGGFVITADEKGAATFSAP